ncbi:hypothetical protein BDQ94DRAFT_155063 [Aspergillus welwitschiae]|uniref:Uncharacterized protein n=1 Tax=Aspergillus welwitschiae TaxID=1341132 RepID=A0A3F3PIZ5_9EURO|nr:hypothetical protein BDQ94DRAFT_155063 [Aspergillus welwitschiae]RDH26712.1 hypothetical protein BDQ94DRAFT_155063 [Aspergillus welwitschiae]
MNVAVSSKRSMASKCFAILNTASNCCSSAFESPWSTWPSHQSRCRTVPSRPRVVFANGKSKVLVSGIKKYRW